MKKYTFMLLFLSFSTLLAQSSLLKGLNSIDQRTAEAHIEFLADDVLEGRESGRKGGKITQKYLISQLKLLGIKPLFDDYLQPFSAYRVDSQSKEPKRYTVNDSLIEIVRKSTHYELKMANVLGKIEGKLPDEFVIVGAHFDHLGIDPYLVGDQIYNGADDNASGVSAVLQLAKAFQISGEKPLRTIIFAFWDGEERGLLGAAYFADKCTFRQNIKAYLNYDMIGRNHKPIEPENFLYFYTKAYPTFRDWLQKDISLHKLKLIPDYRAWENPIGGSDNGSFAKYKIPIIWFHTDAHPDYHKPSDHTNKLNYEKIVHITKASYLIMWRLANEKDF